GVVRPARIGENGTARPCAMLWSVRTRRHGRLASCIQHRLPGCGGRPVARPAGDAGRRMVGTTGLRTPRHPGFPPGRGAARDRRRGGPPGPATLKAMRRFTDLQASQLRLPLERPYRLAFGPVEALDTIVVRVVCAAAGAAPTGEGYGEATLLTGYTEETIDEAWRTARRIVHDAQGHGFDVSATLDRLASRQPFLATAFRTAMEMSTASPALALAAPARVPILGLLQADTPAQVAAETETLLARGSRTRKVKGGFDP